MSADSQSVRPATRPTPAKDPAVNGEEKARATQAAGKPLRRKESTRPWPSRRAVGPSWTEKIEQF